MTYEDFLQCLEGLERYANLIDKKKDESIQEFSKKALDDLENGLANPGSNLSEDDFSFLDKKRRRLIGSLSRHSQSVQQLAGEGGILYKLADVMVDERIQFLRISGQPLKEYIREITNKPLRKALNRRFHAIREQDICHAIMDKAVSWNRTLDKSAQLGRGIDERIIEFPLAFEIAEFGRPGKILDAGAAMNLPYIRELIGMPQAHLTHFTQSGVMEMCQFKNDRYSYLFGDLRATDFRDGTFDRILCISTLEHVGMDNSRYGGEDEETPGAAPCSRGGSHLEAVREMLRLLAPGGELAITIPYGKAKSHGWYQIFDRSMVEEILGVCRGHPVTEKYYYFQGGWYEGDNNVPPQDLANAVGCDVAGLCALLITKVAGSEG